MQYLHFSPHNTPATRLTQYLLLLMVCLTLWFMPATHMLCVALDQKCFFVLNGSLGHSKFWQLLWGYLNHKNESWLNIIVMAVVNLIGIFSLPNIRRRNAFAQVLYFWLFFQIILLVTHTIFADILSIQRASPSLVLSPVVVLSEVLNIGIVKDASVNSFPAGHALVAVYWACFSVHFCQAWVKTFILLTSGALLLARLFSGAHWLSDIAFTSAYALVCYGVAISIPLKETITKYIEYVLRLLSPNRDKIGAL